MKLQKLTGLMGLIIGLSLAASTSTFAQQPDVGAAKPTQDKTLVDQQKSAPVAKDAVKTEKKECDCDKGKCDGKNCAKKGCKACKGKKDCKTCKGDKKGAKCKHCQMHDKKGGKMENMSDTDGREGEPLEHEHEHEHEHAAPEKK